MNRTDFGSGGQ